MKKNYCKSTLNKEQKKNSSIIQARLFECAVLDSQY